MNCFLSNYPDIIKEALIPMIIALFALGFPLLIQTISRIDDKYKSTKLIETFRKDWICKCFLWILLSTIASYVIWLFQIPSLVNIDNFALVLVIINTIALITVTLLIETLRKDWMCKWFLWILFSAIVSEVLWIFQISSPKYFVLIIDNSALILVIINTIALITMTFFIVYLTYIYYVPELLLNRLIKAYDNAKKENDKALYLQAISKILNYSIQITDEPLADKLWEFYFSKIIKLRENKKNAEIVYPKEYYDTFLEANEVLCERNKRAISRFNNNTIFDIFLDSYQQTVISRDTYCFIWKLLLQSLHYDREDLVLSYWRKAHQLCNLFMQNIYPDYDITDGIVKNQAEIDKQDKERNDFLEFHYALGGLLMYKQKYNIIKELMRFTQSQPPKYVLVPERMQQVIERYMKINRWEYYNPVYYEQRYQFPDNYGVNADEMIRIWIKRYLAILFIRQYTLHQHYVNSNPLIMPQPPEDLSELSRWKDELDGLKYYVNDYLSKKDILENLGLDKLCDSNWFIVNNKANPSVLIENFKKQIEDKYNTIKKEQSIDSNKEQEFKEQTIKYLVPIFEKYKNLFNNNQIENNYNRYYIKGQYYLLKKEAFAKNQDTSYLNFDSITAEGAAIQFQHYALNSFISMLSQKYFLTEKDVFGAIDKLKINAENFVIIAVGLYLDYFSYLQIDGLQKENDKWFYNGIEIIKINNYTNELIKQSLLVLKKEDLPNMIFNKVHTDIIEKYHLERIDNTYNIYVALNDLNKVENKTIKEEVEQNNNQADLSNFVLARVDINVEIQYKLKAKYVQLKVFSQFDDRGKANKLEDVQPIW